MGLVEGWAGGPYIWYGEFINETGFDLMLDEGLRQIPYLSLQRDGTGFM